MLNNKLAFLILITSLMFGCTKNLNVNEEFDGDWEESISSNSFGSIAAILAQNDKGSCGQFYIKTSSENENTFLIACTSNGKSFMYYKVLLDDYKVSYLPDSDLQIIEAPIVNE